MKLYPRWYFTAWGKRKVEWLINKVILIGRLCADPEIRYSQGENQMCIARYRLAVNRRFNREGEPNADFINCVAFGRAGEFAEKYFHKGTKIAAVGRIQTGGYERDGQRIYTTDVVIEEQEFAESKGSSDDYTPQPTPSSVGDGFMNVPDGLDSELPFR